MTEEKQPMSALSTVLLPSPLTGDCSRGSALTTPPLPSPLTEYYSRGSALTTVPLPSLLTEYWSRGSALSQETNNVLKKKSETAPGGLDHSKFYH